MTASAVTHARGQVGSAQLRPAAGPDRPGRPGRRRRRADDTDERTPLRPDERGHDRSQGRI